MNEATVILDGLTLTEGPRWHAGKIWFSDLYNQRVCSAAEDGSDFQIEAEVPGIPSGLGWLPDGRLLVVVQAEQRLVRREHDGSLVLHADLSAHAKHWTNDMVVASDGSAYVGCFGFDLHNHEPYDAAPLMRITPDGDVSVVGEPMHFPNGSIIIDSKTLVVAESFGNRISQFDILPDGSLANRQDWATFGAVPVALDLDERYAELVIAPDGIAQVDAEGAIWIADFTKRYAMRVRLGGEIVDRVSTGELNCYAVALGGADGRTLFLCATPSEMDPTLRKHDPRGTVQAYRVDVPLAS